MNDTIICPGCQQIDQRLKQVYSMMTDYLVHMEFTTRCDKCGKFIFTGRVYNNSLMIGKVVPMNSVPTLLKKN